MSWLFLAVIGHLANAVAFIIDKILLTTAFKKSATYAAMIATLSLVVLFAVPWVKQWPGIELALPILAYGGFFVFALWAFFEALKRSEASQVVPVVGSLIPLFTLLGTWTLLGERLTGRELIGFGFLIVATVVLTAQSKTSPKPLMILSAILFAASFVAGKFAYNHADFLAVFVSSRAVAGILGLVIGLLYLPAREELKRVFLSFRTKGEKSRDHIILIVVSQLLGALGFILINIAIAQGSAPLVNALQAVQYAAIVLVAWFATDRLRKLLNEKLTPRTILMKSSAILLIAIGLGLIYGRPTVDRTTQYGVTWSKPYAEALGIDPYEGLQATLDDLGVRRFRIPVYWSEIEPRPGEFEWDALTRQLEMIRERGGRVILVIGAKQPRWPEWWAPDWLDALSQTDQEAAQLSYAETVMRHYADYGAFIEAWQVENEPLFSFGMHKAQSKEFVKKEIQLVRRLEAELSTGKKPRPIYTTDSGELSLWRHFRHDIDGLGVSVYRVVIHPHFGVWRYTFLPPWFYAQKAALLDLSHEKVFVSEFQMEPWATKPLTELPIEDQLKTFDFKQMRRNFWYAKHMGMPEIYFWGTEWWFWMKEKQNHPEFWEEAKSELKQN